METLLDFLATPHPGGRVKIAHVRGEAGLGKSRLVHEALRRLGAEGRTAWWEASPSTTNILLSPAMEWLRRRLRLRPGDDVAEADRAIDRLLAEALPEEQESAVYLKYIFGVPQALERLHGMAADHIQANLFALLRMLLWGAAQGEIGRAHV